MKCICNNNIGSFLWHKHELFKFINYANKDIIVNSFEIAQPFQTHGKNCGLFEYYLGFSHVLQN
jgi:hypothetical protein